MNEFETLPEDLETENTSEEVDYEKLYKELLEKQESETQEISFEEIRGSVRVNAVDSDTRSSFSNLDSSRLVNTWDLTINGNSYKVLFPRTDDLVVVDGVLVNIGSSNIVGTVIGDTINLGTYFQKTFTVMPLTGSNAQNSAYRYGAHAYLTTYSTPAQGYNLNTVVDYGDARVNSTGKFGSQWTSFNIVVIGLLALSVLISFIGGLLRRG